MIKQIPFFIIDVESIGVHGEGFAVAGGIFIDGKAKSEFVFSCPSSLANGDESDRQWVSKNVPDIKITHDSLDSMRDDFWIKWLQAKAIYPNITMAGECIYPVETNFISSCVKLKPQTRAKEAPYPFHDIASIMFASGMDCMATYSRQPTELPAHEPLADVRLSARLLNTALQKKEIK